MELDVRVGSKSLTISIDNPFHVNIDELSRKIEKFIEEHGASREGLDFRGLLPKMVKGIAGCEGGCPADAKSFVSRGFSNFKLAYIEGGILQAQTTTSDGKQVSVNMFPDF